MKVKVISLPYIFQVLYVLCFSRARYQVSVHRTIGPLVIHSRKLVDFYPFLGSGRGFRDIFCVFVRIFDFTHSFLFKSYRKAMNRNWSNQKANPALKTKMGNE